MALGSTKPLTEKGTRNLPGVKGWPAHMTDNLTAICEPIIYKLPIFKVLLSFDSFRLSRLRISWSVA
jgi:hypothetical protein